METPIKTDDLGVPLFLETPVCTFWYLAGWRGTQHEKYIWKSTFVVGSEVDQHRLGMAQLDTWKQFRALSFLFETPMIPMILIYFNQFFLIYWKIRNRILVVNKRIVSVLVMLNLFKGAKIRQSRQRGEIERAGYKKAQPTNILTGKICRKSFIECVQRNRGHHHSFLRVTSWGRNSAVSSYPAHSTLGSSKFWGGLVDPRPHLLEMLLLTEWGSDFVGLQKLLAELSTGVVGARAKRSTVFRVCFTMHFPTRSWKKTTHPLQAGCLWRNWLTFLRNRMGRAFGFFTFQRLHVQPRSRCPVHGRHAVGWA